MTHGCQHSPRSIFRPASARLDSLAAAGQRQGRAQLRRGPFGRALRLLTYAFGILSFALAAALLADAPDPVRSGFFPQVPHLEHRSRALASIWLPASLQAVALGPLLASFAFAAVAYLVVLIKGVPHAARRSSPSTQTMTWPRGRGRTCHDGRSAAPRRGCAGAVVPENGSEPWRQGGSFHRFPSFRCPENLPRRRRPSSPPICCSVPEN